MSDLRLYHYTCSHGVDGITADGHVKPYLHPFLGVDVSWWTDLDVPLRDALGLTSIMLDCDRTVHRFEAATGEPVWWPVWRRNYIRDCGRTDLARGAVEAIEGAPGAMPARWWVSEVPVPVVRVEAGVR